MSERARSAGRPARFLVTTWDGGGNVPPALALGQRLARRGHDVRVIGSRTLRSPVRGSGLSFVPYDTVPDWPAGMPLDADLAGLGAMLDSGEMAMDIVAELDRRPADVLVADCMSGAALAAAAYMRVPTAILVHLLYEPYAERWGRAARDLDGPRRAVGLGPLPSRPLGESLAALGRVLCLTPPGFDAPLPELPDETFYVGPVLSPEVPAARWSRRGDAPLVLLSFSTTLMQQADALPPVLEALAPLPVEGVLTLGGALAPAAIQAPANFAVHEFVPHAAILPNTSVVVTHGGLSTITTALAYGAPLVCIPQGRDQSLNAARVADSGVGIEVPSDAPGAAIAAAITTVLEGGRYRAAATAMAESIHRLGRGEEAARLTEGLLD